MQKVPQKPLAILAHRPDWLGELAYGGNYVHGKL